jgi:hypothetical protein
MPAKECRRLRVRVARFFGTTCKNGKINQMTITNNKWPQNIPNGHKIYQMATKYTKWPQNMYTSKAVKYTNINISTSPMKKTLKFTQIGIFGMKIYHLATLLRVAQNCQRK